MATRGGGVLCRDPQTGKWKAVRTDPANPHSLPSDRRATQSWRTWAADPANPKALLSDSVAAILVDRFGAVWLGGNKGLSRYDPKKDRFESWRSEGDKPPLPARVFSLLETPMAVSSWEPAMA